MDHPTAVRWTDDGLAVDMLDQTRLPAEEVRLRLESAESVAEAICALRVRGAPAIGIAAAMGLAADLTLAAKPDLPHADFWRRYDAADAVLRASRPTGANLFHVLDRMATKAAAYRAAGDVPGAVAALRAEATAILEEDRAMCRRIGEHGLGLLPDGARVLTHCNAGALATGGMGTALAPIYLAHAAGRRVQVYACETRPLLQGIRITAWELGRAGVPVTVLADSAAGSLLAGGGVDLVIVGADRVAANGDVANKIGTYPLAVLAARHDVPFYVAVPVTTLDAGTAAGDAIEVERRDPDEVRRPFGEAISPPAVPVYAPAFDITPAELVTGIITDAGVLRAPYGPGIVAAVESAAGRSAFTASR